VAFFLPLTQQTGEASDHQTQERRRDDEKICQKQWLIICTLNHKICQQKLAYNTKLIIQIV
jgi:hypothetical protein